MYAPLTSSHFLTVASDRVFLSVQYNINGFAETQRVISVDRATTHWEVITWEFLLELKHWVTKLEKSNASSIRWVSL